MRRSLTVCLEELRKDASAQFTLLLLINSEVCVKLVMPVMKELLSLGLEKASNTAEP